MKFNHILFACLWSILVALCVNAADIDKKSLEAQVSLSADEQTRIDLRKTERFSKELTKSFKHGLEFQERKRYREAISAYEKVLKMKPALTEASYNIGLCLEKLGDYQKAEDIFSELVKKDPLFDLGLRHLAYISFKCGNFEQAYLYHQKHLETGRP